jgi:hypothetical protein
MAEAAIEASSYSKACVVFPMRIVIRNLFMKNLTKVHEKHIQTDLPNNKVKKSQFDCRDPSVPFLPCNHLLSPCTSGTFEI